MTNTWVKDAEMVTAALKSRSVSAVIVRRSQWAVTPSTGTPGPGGLQSSLNKGRRGQNPPVHLVTSNGTRAQFLRRNRLLSRAQKLFASTQKHTSHKPTPDVVPHDRNRFHYLCWCLLFCPKDSLSLLLFVTLVSPQRRRSCLNEERHVAPSSVHEEEEMDSWSPGPLLPALPGWLVISHSHSIDKLIIQEINIVRK